MTHANRWTDEEIAEWVERENQRDSLIVAWLCAALFAVAIIAAVGIVSFPEPMITMGCNSVCALPAAD